MEYRSSSSQLILESWGKETSLMLDVDYLQYEPQKKQIFDSLPIPQDQEKCLQTIKTWFRKKDNYQWDIGDLIYYEYSAS